jgi:D-3-phosphoglycerate dehydrogenase
VRASHKEPKSCVPFSRRGLDVFEVEPLTSPLLKFDNVLFAGHTAGMDNESKFDTFKMCAESLVTLHNGGWPAECVVNLPGVTGWKWKKG